MKYLNPKISFKRFGFLISFLIISGFLNKGFAQTAATYGFSTSNGTYTAITGGTLLSSGTPMDDAKFSVTIPSFTFLGVAYTQVYVTENGYLQFGSSIPTALSGYLSTTTAVHTAGIAAYNRDLKGRTTASLRTQTVGSETIFQWTDLTNFGSTAQNYTFQIRLNSATNEIRVVYGTFASTALTNGQVGIRGSATDFNVRTTTTSWATSAAATTNTATMDVSATVTPTSGLNYIWTPPVPCTAKPVGGTLASSAGTAIVCPSSPVDLSVSGATTATGIAYQWDISTVSGTGPWTPITGATAAALTATPPACSDNYYRRRIICTTVSLFDSSTSVLVKVKCATAPPYFEDFESITVANALPNCMTATNLGSLVTTYLTAPGSYNRTNHTPSGNKFAAFRYSAKDYIFTPPIILTAGRTYEFSFWYITDGLGGWDTLKAMSGATASAAAMTTAVGTPLSKLTNSVYQKYSATFVPSATGEQVFGINCQASGVPWYLSIDDVKLVEVADCSGAPVAGSPIANPTKICSTGPTELDLPGLVVAKGYTYQWQDSTAGSTWGNDISRPTFGGNVVPFKTSDINKTTYFRCIVTCTFSGQRTITPVIMVSAGPITPPYFENFESIKANNEYPVCMSSTSTATVLTYTAPFTSYNRINHTPGGSKYASFRYLCDDYLFSPPMSFVAGYQYILSFWYITDGLSGWNTLGAKVGTDATAAGMTIPLKSILTPGNTTYQQYVDTFIAPSSGTYYFGIYCNGTIAPWYISIDDIGLQMRPCDSKPVAGTVNSTVPSGAGICPNTFATLTTTGATPPFIAGIKYQWQRRNLSAPGVWLNVAGATKDVLSADTLSGYEYRMAVICTNTSDSTFTTAYGLPQLPQHPPITITPSASPISFCLGDTVKFTASNFTATVYDWMRDSVVIPGWKFSDFSATESGRYMVKATAPGLPCPAYSNSVLLNINNPGYEVALAAPTDSFICEGTNISLAGTASKGGVTYQWTKNNVNIPGATANTYLASVSGFYRLEAFDGISLCPALSRSIQINVRPNPVANLKVPGGTTTACENDGVLLKVSSDAAAYEWTRNGTTVVGVTDSAQLVKASGVYRVKVRSSEGCVSLSNTVTVNILPAPVPLISKSGLVLSTGVFRTYKWVLNGTDTVGFASTLNLTKRGIYKVIVEDLNGCIGISNPIEVDDATLSIGNVAIDKDQIRIYPNPSTGLVNIESPVVIDVEVKDITGRSIISTKNATLIDLGKYPDGVYIFIISNNENMISQQRITKLTNR